MKHISKILFVFALCLSSSLMAKVKLPQIYSSNMVFQRDRPIPIWGWADAGEKIDLSFMGNTYTTQTQANGKWELVMKAASFGGPYTLKVNDVILNDILIGDVFLCSGQSNMAFLLMNSDNGEEAISKSENPNIRLFTVPRDIEFYSLDDISTKTSWEVCNPQSVRKFSAVAYYMARKLQKDLNIPIGLVHSSYGGTVIEGFISAKPLDTIARFKPILEKIGSKNKQQFIASSVADLEKVHGKINQNLTGDILWDTIKPVLPSYNSHWSTMQLPTLWEKAGLPNVDGVIWFYKEINLTEEECKKDAFLSLGRIADQSVTYFNNVKLGSSIDSRDFIRDYRVPKDLLKEGTNKILVRVANKGRNGGIWGPQSRLYFKSGNGNKIAIDGDWNYKIQDISIAIHPNDVPSSIYNAMINPLRYLEYKGAIWYQGESNANWANEYQGLLEMMIYDWRKQFNQPILPFVIIQLPNYKAVKEEPDPSSTWAFLREAQAKAAKTTNSGLVNTIDLGLADNIHPTNKTSVGDRLALKVEQLIYGQKVEAAPTIRQVTFKNNQAVLDFNDADGLTLNKNSTRSNFMIAGEDQKFVWADAKLVGDQVVVWSESVKKPLAIRYAWADNPGENYLYNQAGLPLEPFRTDNWFIKIEMIPR